MSTGHKGQRRQWLRWLAGTVGALGAGGAGLGRAMGAEPPVAPGAAPGVKPSPGVRPETRLRFPQDFGSHPDLRTEWWYLTGWLSPPDAPPGATPQWGFQLTFFRSRTDLGADSRSAFAPRQLIVLHAALTDVRGQRLWHTQQVARAGLGVADAAEGDTQVHLREASLRRSPAGVYEGLATGPDFRLQLQARPTQPLMLQGQAGYSRKGPQPAQASHYYSEPQLAVSATLRAPGAADQRLQGRAWLDHEWSETVMDAQAVGWDWIGMNLDDGSALMAFQLRDRAGRPVWAGGSWRSPGGEVQAFAPAEVRWRPQAGATWASARTGARYPTAWQLEVGGRRYTVQALVRDQEQDTRGSTGTAYWEGLSALHDAQGRRVGWGYLEMTGYAGQLKL